MNVFTPDARFESWWWETAPRRSGPYPALPARTDVAVIGGGYTGLSAALELAKAGRLVAVIEAETPGFGASSRNGGMIGSGHRVPFAELETTYGFDAAMGIVREGRRALEFATGLIEREAIDCDHKRVGRFRCAWRPADYEAMAREADFLRDAIDLEADMIPRAEQHAEIASDRYHGGCLFHAHGGLHPAKFHQGLWDRAAAAGATVIGGQRVTGLDADGDGHIVRTGGGEIRAGEVIVATNGYTAGESPAIRDALMPIASYMIATEPLGANRVKALIPNARMIVETRSRACYYRPSPDGERILLGGRAALRHIDPAKSGPILRQLLLSVLPQLEDARLTHSWKGTLGFTWDHLPRIGKNRQGVHYAFGYSGSGVAMAPYLGWRVARKVLGAADAACELDRIPVKPVQFRFALPLALPFVEMWYRIKDMREGA